MYLVTTWPPHESRSITYLFRSTVNVLHIDENSDCPGWLPLQHLLYHIFVFREVLNITCISFTWAKRLVFVINTSKGITYFEGETCILQV